MKNLAKLLAALTITGILTASFVGCGNSDCAALDKKKSDCDKAGPGKDGCVQGIDAAVKANNGDACKAMLDSLNKSLK